MYRSHLFIFRSYLTLSSQSNFSVPFSLICVIVLTRNPFLGPFLSESFFLDFIELFVNFVSRYGGGVLSQCEFSQPRKIRELSTFWDITSANIGALRAPNFSYWAASGEDRRWCPRRCLHLWRYRMEWSSLSSQDRWGGRGRSKGGRGGLERVSRQRAASTASVAGGPLVRIRWLRQQVIHGDSCICDSIEWGYRRFRPRFVGAIEVWTACRLS